MYCPFHVPGCGRHSIVPTEPSIPYDSITRTVGPTSTGTAGGATKLLGKPLPVICTECTLPRRPIRAIMSAVLCEARVQRVNATTAFPRSSTSPGQPSFEPLGARAIETLRQPALVLWKRSREWDPGPRTRTTEPRLPDLNATSVEPFVTRATRMRVHVPFGLAAISTVFPCRYATNGVPPAETASMPSWTLRTASSADAVPAVASPNATASASPFMAGA